MSILGLKLGNGWILSIFYVLFSCLPMFFGGKGTVRLFDFSWISSRGKSFPSLVYILFFVFIIYPFFLQIKLGTFLFYVGISIFSLSSIAISISYVNYFTTPLNQLISKGMYQISRNPMYVFYVLMTFALALMCHSLILASLAALYVFLQHFLILEEEKFCLQTYGDSYLDYKQRVPRYLLFF